jgi:hypothetical protein
MLMISRLATAESTRATSTFCPSPVWILLNTAARMPMAQESPPRTSPMAVPVRVGSPPGQPVVLMRPLMAWEMMS